MILITGATGNVGRELARELDERGAEFRILVRDLARATGLPGRAFTGDLNDPATLGPAFAGADRVFLVTPGIGTAHAINAVAAARAAGVRHIVHLSSFNTEDGHAGKEYVLTGAETFTIAEQVAVIGTAIGRDIEVRAAATPEDIVRSRWPDGAPKPLADAIIEAAELMRADTSGFRTDTFARLTGRGPRTFADWCGRNACAFR